MNNACFDICNRSLTQKQQQTTELCIFKREKWDKEAKVIPSNCHLNMSFTQGPLYENVYRTSQSLCSHCMKLCVVPGCLVPELAAAALECVSAPLAAVECWPESASSSAPVAPLDVALHLPALRTPSLAAGRCKTKKVNPLKPCRHHQMPPKLLKS